MSVDDGRDYHKIGILHVTSSNGNIFRVTCHLCGEFRAQKPVTRSFDVFFDLRLNKRLSKQSWGWWFETLSRPLWRHRNGFRSLWLNNDGTDRDIISHVSCRGWCLDRNVWDMQIHGAIDIDHANFNCLSPLNNSLKRFYLKCEFNVECFYT